MARVDPAAEAGKVGLFVAVVALMAWATNKAKGTWFEILFFRGRGK
jgi:hypothetical protein